MAKKVNYRGKQYTVPDWVKFIATEPDGCVLGYEEKPVINKIEGIFETTGRVECIGWIEWEDTLQEID